MNADVGTLISCASKQFSFANSVASLNNAANCYAVTARNTQQTCGLLFLVKSMHDDVALHIKVSLYSTKKWPVLASKAKFVKGFVLSDWEMLLICMHMFSCV